MPPSIRPPSGDEITLGGGENAVDSGRGSGVLAGRAPV